MPTKQTEFAPSFLQVYTQVRRDRMKHSHLLASKIKIFSLRSEVGETGIPLLRLNLLCLWWWKL